MAVNHVNICLKMCNMCFLLREFSRAWLRKTAKEISVVNACREQNYFLVFFVYLIAVEQGTEFSLSI